MSWKQPDLGTTLENLHVLVPLTRAGIDAAVVYHHLFPSAASLETLHDVPCRGDIRYVQVVGLWSEKARVQDVHGAVDAAQVEEDSVRTANVGDDKGWVRVYKRAALAGTLGGVFTEDLLAVEDGTDAKFELRMMSGLGTWKR